MADVNDRIAEKLEDLDLYPERIVFNSEFTCEVFAELYDFYDLDSDFEIGEGALNAIYMDFQSHSRMSEEEHLLH